MTDNGSTPEAARRRFYGWWLAVIGAVIMAIGTVPLFQAPSLWLVVLSQSFGWTPFQISWAFTVTRVEGALLWPIAGWGVARLGPRKMVFIGLAVLGVGFLLFSRTASLGIFYLSFGIIGLGSRLCAWLPVETALNNWFHLRRATAMSIPMLGLGLGGISIVPLLAWSMGWDVQTAMELPGRPGWRNTALAVGAVGLAASVPLALLVRNRPEDYGQRPDGATAETDASVPDYSWRAAVKSGQFWLLVAAGACYAAADSAALALHQPTNELGSTLVVVQSLIMFAFILPGGLFGDRVSLRLALCVFGVVQALALAGLAAGGPAGLFLFSILVGASRGGRMGPSLAIYGTYFGRRNFATIVAIFSLVSDVAGLLTSAIVSANFAAAGDVAISVLIALGISTAGAALYLLAGSPRLGPSQPQSPIAEGPSTD